MLFWISLSITFAIWFVIIRLWQYAIEHRWDDSEAGVIALFVIFSFCLVAHIPWYLSRYEWLWALVGLIPALGILIEALSRAHEILKAGSNSSHLNRT